MPQNQIIGTENNDFLSDTTLDDDIFALEGDDQIELSSGNDWVDGGAGNDELTINYSESNEDLMFNLQGYQNYTGYDYPSIDGSINVHSYTTAYNSFINFHNIESFSFISGSGNDQIDLGYENVSNDLIDAGAGNDLIFAGWGDDKIDGGSGFDVLRLDFSLLTPETRVISQLTNSNGGEYHYGLNTIKFSNIEAIDFIGSYQDDIVVAPTPVDSYPDEPVPYPMNSIIDGREGKDQLVADYSHQSEDLMFNLQGYQNYTGYDYPSIDGSIEVHSYMTGYNNRIDFYNIESFNFISGSGNDHIDLGYDNFSDDLIDAGAGNDFISAGLGDDKIDGGSGFDVLRLDFSQLAPETRVISQLTNSNGGEYHYGLNTIKFSNIEAIDLIGSYQDDIVVAPTPVDSYPDEPVPYPMNSIIDGREGKDQLVADYSHQSEDLMFNLQGYQNYTGYDYPSIDGSIEVHSYMTGYNNRIDFYNIESFNFISGSGNDHIDLGYDNFSDDLIDAGAGNDFISAGLGDDKIDGGSGFDVLRLDFSQLAPETRVISQLTNSNGGEYHYGLNTIKFSNIEAIDLIGSYQDDIVVAPTPVDSYPDEPVPYPMNSIIDGREGKDQLVADYSHQSEDLMFNLQSYGSYHNPDYVSIDGSIEVHSYMTGYNNRIDFYNVESFNFISGSGNDHIDLGYDNFSDDVIDAGAGNDIINAGWGNDTINGGSGSDIFIYELGYGTDVIADHSGTGDTIVLAGIALNDLSVSFDDQDLIFSFLNSPDDRLIIENYADSFDSIESIEVEGQIFSVEEIIELRNHPITIVDTGTGNNVIADYSDYNEDLQFWLNPLDPNPVLEINSHMTGYIAHIDLDNDSSLEIHSGSGNDHIDLGYDNFSDDLIDAGAGNDFISAGLGDDKIDGGSDFDVLRLDFSLLTPETRVISQLTDSNGGEYHYGLNTIKFSNIEAIDFIGSYQDDIVVAPTPVDSYPDEPVPYPMNSIIDGREGKDQLVADYSHQSEDLMFNLQGYQNYTGYDYPSIDGSIEVHSYMTGYNSRIDFYNIESFNFISGSGNDHIDLGYDNFSDDLIDAGAGNDLIFAGWGNDTIDGGSGFDVLRLDFSLLTPETRVISQLTDSNGGEYHYGLNTIKFSNIEAIDLIGSYQDDILVAPTPVDSYPDEPVPYPMNSIIDGKEGKDQLVADYSHQSEDLMFNLQGYQNYTGYDYPSIDGSIEVHSYMTGYNNRIDFYNIESFNFISGSGNDHIDLGYDNFSDDLIDAGAGNDFISAGLGDDKIDGGSGFDVLRLDFSQLAPETRVISQLTDSNGGEYHYGLNTIKFSNIEAIDFIGSYQDDIVVAPTPVDSYPDEPVPYPMNSIIDGREGKDQLVADYSHQSEDLMFNLQSYGNYYSPDYVSIDGSIEVHSYMTGYNNRIDFYNVESFNFISGSGNDHIDLGYDNFSDDVIDAGAGNDIINAGWGNDTINGGSGSDTFIYELGYGTDVIADHSGTGDTIVLAGIALNDLSVSFDDQDLIFSFLNSPDDRLIIENYADSFDSIESIEVEGQIFSVEEIIELRNHPITIVDTGAGNNNLIADYSDYNEDLQFWLNPLNPNPFLEINSHMTGYIARIGLDNVGSFEINSGSGNDFIDVGYEYFSDDLITAGAGDDVIIAGFGNDTIDGGVGSDRYLYELGHGTDIIFDAAGENDTIDFGWGISPENLRFNFNDSDLILSFVDSPEDQLIVQDYLNLEDRIEAIEIAGQSFSIPSVKVIESGLLIADYSDYSEDLQFWLNPLDPNPFLEINSHMTGYIARIGLDNVGSFEINSGSGNDFIDVGYEYFSDDLITAGAGDDVIIAGLGNDTIDGGVGSDRYIYELGHGTDTIFDAAGENDTIDFGWGISPENLRFNFNDSDLILSFVDSPEDQLIVQDYLNLEDRIEAIEIAGQSFSIPSVKVIESGHLIADYSDYNEDLQFWLNPLDPNPFLEINSHMTGYIARIGLDNVGSFEINSGSGNDFIDVGYEYFSDDLITAGAGDDVIVAGLGNDTIDGGVGSDRYIYELGHGTDTIFDAAGENDTIDFGWGMTLDSLSLEFNDNDLTFHIIDSLEDSITIKDYFNSLDSIENIDISGQVFSLEEVIALKSEPEPQTIGEFGQVNNFDHNSRTIQLDHSYENPVVFALPLSRNGGDPSVVRITDIQDDSFTAYLQEAEYKDGTHTTESFSYMVLEAGTWELDNGALLEVNTVDTNKTTKQDWEEIDFNADFVSQPVILSQVQTNLDDEFVRTRQNLASVDGFSLSLEEEEALRNSGHGQETVGWLAIDSGVGDLGDLQYQAGHTARIVDHRYYNLGFEQEFSSNPSLFASLASFYGGDASGLRYRNLSETQVQIMIEEDQSSDSETGHTKEIVDFLAIAGTGDLTAIAYEPNNFI